MDCRLADSTGRDGVMDRLARRTRGRRWYDARPDTPRYWAFFTAGTLVGLLAGAKLDSDEAVTFTIQWLTAVAVAFLLAWMVKR
jgi:hypothetical protein